MAAMTRPDALKHKRQMEVSASVSISCGMTWLFFGVAIESRKIFTEPNMVLRTDVSSRCKLEKEKLVVTCKRWLAIGGKQTATDLRLRLAGTLRFDVIFDVLVEKDNEFDSGSCSTLHGNEAFGPSS